MATIIKEGKAEIVFPEGNKVFYNPIQEFNRDLSLAVINCWSEDFIEKRKSAMLVRKKRRKTDPTKSLDDVVDEILVETVTESVIETPFTLFEGLAATGLRSLRYALELIHPALITANDYDETATASLALNIEHNKLSHLITPSTGDCNQVLWNTIGID